MLQIGQYPGFDPAWLDMLIESGNIKGIIIESLGIGNLPTLKSKYNLLPVIGKAIKEHQIPVIITSRYPINPEFTDKYIPATEPLQLGVISAGNMTSSAALTKLMWLLPQIEKDIKNGDLKEQYKLEEIRKLMAHSYVGEVDKIKVLGESSR
ncbi:MAG: L-asparaginase [Acidobacteriota bacterium]|nr:L-asparaginase [Acidobacteriota bacterium]